MSVQPFIPWLIAAYVPSVIGQVLGARMGAPWVSGAAAVFLPVISILVAMRVNGPYWSQSPALAGHDVLIAASQRNARLLAWAWGAGALSMLAVYLVSGLRWQHGWQYGSGMMLIAGIGFSYALSLSDPESVFRRPVSLNIAALLAAAQGIAAIGGITILVLSGKVASPRSDWAANIIFVSGGLAVTVLSAIAVRTHAYLTQYGFGPDRSQSR
jgi:hypothetical protein